MRGHSVNGPRITCTELITQIHLLKYIYITMYAYYLTRNHCNQKIRQSQDIKDLCRGMTVKTHLEKRMRRLPRKDINEKNLGKILQVLVQLDIILQNITLVIKHLTLFPGYAENKLYNQITLQLP